MKLKDRTNLLKDLCARVPYGIKGQCLGRVVTVRSIDTFGNTEVEGFNGSIVIDISHVKPYLFPMSSMTKEQKIMICALQDMGPSYYHSIIDHYNEWNLDYRGLIEKGLANDATNLNIY